MTQKWTNLVPESVHGTGPGTPDDDPFLITYQMIMYTVGPEKPMILTMCTYKGGPGSDPGVPKMVQN